MPAIMRARRAIGTMSAMGGAARSMTDPETAVLLTSAMGSRLVSMFVPRVIDKRDEHQTSENAAGQGRS
jgi:hypothetical protein